MKRLIWLAVAFLLAGVAFAQDPVTGIPPFSSIESGGFDNINRQNLNANVSFPIVSVPARGGSFGFAVVNDSLIWKKVTVGSTTSWTPVTDKNGNPTYGWLNETPVGQTPYSYSTIRCHDADRIAYEYIDKYSNYSYYDARGARHPFTVATIVSCWVGGTSVGYATDGSGYKIDITNPTAPRVWNKVGDQMTSTSGYVLDNNGNKISFSVAGSVTTWTDTAGHSALVVDKSNANYIDYKFYDNTGTQQAFRLNLDATARNIKTNFGCSGVVEFTGTQALPISLVNLVNNQSFQFTYEDTPGFSGYSTGRVKRITLPTGGYVEYQYPTTGNNGINCSDATVTSLTRVVSDGVSSATWQFTRSAITGSAGTTTVTAPALPYDAVGNDTVYTFDSNGHETSQKFYQGVAPANLLRTINTTWASNGTPSTFSTILEDGLTTSETDTTYDSKGNLLTLAEHDWGSGGAGPVLRTTTYTYLAGSSYTSLNILDRVTRVIVSDSAGTIKSRTDIAYDEANYINATCVTGATQHDDTNYGCTFTTRGLPTTVTVYTDPVTPAGGISKHTYYDSLGNAVQADVNCCQQEQWIYSATTNYAFPDSVVRGPAGNQLTTTAMYNGYTGLVASTTDENNQTTSYSYDALKRLTAITRPDTAQITYSYTDAAPPAQSSVTVTTPIQGTNLQKQTTTVDGLGRPIKQQTTDAGSASYSIAETQYDPLGKPYRAYNPHNSTRQYYTESRFDALGRPVKTVLQDNSQVTYSYATTTATVTDPAGNQRKFQVDGLGRFVSVYEPDVTTLGNPLTVQTSYAFTVFDTTATVSQGAQTRTYNYDALGRLTIAATPEVGTVNFQYDPVFYTLVTQRTDARGAISSYSYDSLNRLQQMSYNVGTTGVPATPTVTLAYGTSQAQNNNGRLITMTDGVGSETYSYDVLGRTTQVQKVINGTTYTTVYGYNAAGELTSTQYPSGRTVQPNYDAIGRLSVVAATLNSITTTYASGFGYNPAFELTGLNYGNGVAANFGYSNDRLQLTSLSYIKGTQTLFSLSYAYTQSGGNNGQITSITDGVDSGRTASYTYDALYRLKTAVTNGSAGYPQWGLSWTYDRYGNRAAQAVTAGSAPPNSVTVDATTNRITGAPYSYDASGNMTNDGLNALGYDAENRIVTSSGSSYSYDGKSLRVQKVSGGTTTVYVFSGMKVIAEYVNGAAPGSPSREYIYSGSQLLAKIEGGTTNYYHTDHLSARVTTDTSGNLIGQQGHYPYGESWYAASATTKWQFTGYERDSESGNDYAMMRYHVNRLGRYSSPDPLSGSAADPQSLNRFAYVRNDAVNGVDLSAC
jgi:RHS repeat-associated protein